MTIFETVTKNIPIREAALRYGLDIDRAGRAKCPFHNDSGRSLFVGEDRFYCRGCGEYGDLVRFMGLYWGIRYYHAAKLLARDYDLDPNLPPSMEAAA